MRKGQQEILKLRRKRKEWGAVASCPWGAGPKYCQKIKKYVSCE